MPEREEQGRLMDGCSFYLQIYGLLHGLVPLSFLLRLQDALCPIFQL